MRHEIREFGHSDRWPAKSPTWRCSCGSEFSSEEDAEYHAANASAVPYVSPYDVDEWPFPSVTYNYAAARVGDVCRNVEIDSAEISNILQHYKTAPRKVFP